MEDDTRRRTEDYLCVYTNAGPFDVLPASARMIVGTYQVDGENHGKKVFRRMEDAAKKFLPDVVCFFWDDRDGEEASGWWFGSEVGGGQTWARNPAMTEVPPLRGWRCPSDGPVQEHVICRKPFVAPSPHVAWLRPKVKEEGIVKEEALGTPAGGPGLAEAGEARKRPLPPGVTEWIYTPSNGADICMRRLPELEAPRNGFWMAPGEVFQVCDERCDADDGITYLKLADGRGWVFDYRPGVGLMCSPKLPDEDDPTPAGKRHAAMAKEEEEEEEEAERTTDAVARIGLEAEEALKASRAAREAGRGGSGDEALVEAMRRLLAARGLSLERALALLAGSRAAEGRAGPLSFEDEEAILSDGLRALLGCVRDELLLWDGPPGAAPPESAGPASEDGRPEAGRATEVGAAAPLLPCKEEPDQEPPPAPRRPPPAPPQPPPEGGGPPAPRQGLQRWAERVHALAGGDAALLQRCRDFVRGRILEGHAAGLLDEIDWDDEPLPSLEHL